MGSENGQGGHVIIRAPTATAAAPFAPPTPEEIVQFQAAQIRELEKELAQRTVAASTIANAAINLLDLLCATTDFTRETGVVIPPEQWAKTRGLQLTVEGDEATGEVTVRAREAEKPAPLAYEDRRDD